MGDHGVEVDSFGNLLSQKALPVPPGEMDHGVEVDSFGNLLSQKALPVPPGETDHGVEMDSAGNLGSTAPLPVPPGETDHGVEMSRAGILSCFMVPALGGPALVVLAVGLLLAGGVLGRFSVGLRLRWS